MNRALLFSGQGSQYVGMLKDIADKYSTAKDKVRYAESILGYKISDICFHGPLETLTETRYTQPALFLHSAIIMDLLDERLPFDAVAGHSVGEYAALYASNVLSFKDALKLVALRGELMFKAGEIEPGTMFAVIGIDDEKVEKVCEELNKNGNGNVVVPANYNSPGQIVVSGSAQYLRENIIAFKKAGAKIVKELVVSGAFHSPLLTPVKKELEQAILSVPFRKPKVPIYTNVYAKPSTDVNEIREALIAQLTSPVRWTHTLLLMKQYGINEFIEIGPGKVLQGLVKRTLENVLISGIDNAEEIVKYL